MPNGNILKCSEAFDSINVFDGILDELIAGKRIDPGMDEDGWLTTLRMLSPGRYPPDLLSYSF